MEIDICINNNTKEINFSFDVYNLITINDMLFAITYNKYIYLYCYNTKHLIFGGNLLRMSHELSGETTWFRFNNDKPHNGLFI